MKRKYFILLIILVIFISIFNPFISSKVKAVNQSFNLENLLNLIPNDFQENNEIILDSIEINNVRKIVTKFISLVITRNYLKNMSGIYILKKMDIHLIFHLKILKINQMKKYCLPPNIR